MKRYLRYISYVIRHKWYVFRAAQKLGVPWLGALHDLSKFRPSELVPYAEHFYHSDGSTKTYKAQDGFFQDLANDVAFDWAWLTHIKRNKHHPQHWVNVRYFECACPGATVYTYPSRMQRPRMRPDVLLNDDGYARCLNCNSHVKITTARAAHILILDVHPIPLKYVREMLADWIGAGAAQGTPDTLGWYHARGRYHIFHPVTRAQIEHALGYRTWVEQHGHAQNS